MPGTTASKPERMAIVCLATGTELTAQYNPTELETTTQVIFGRPVVPGMSHQEMQYSHTENLKLPVSLAFDALAPMRADTYDALGARRFLESLCYAPRGASTVRAGSPPRVLFVWPNLMTLQCHITSFKTKFTRFARVGIPTAFSCSLDLEEVRDVRLCFEDVLATGMIRSGTKVSEEL